MPEGMSVPKIVSAIGRIVALVEDRWLCIAVSLMGLIIFSDVLTRILTGASIYAAQEMVSYLSISVIAIGAATATRDEKHIDVDIIYRYLPGRAPELLKIINAFFTLFMTVIWVSWTLPFVTSAFQMGEVSPMMHVPMFIVKGLLLLGAVLMVIYSICVVVKKLRAYATKAHPTKTEQIGN